MAKKNLFKVCLVIALAMSASSAFAAGITGSTVLGGGTFAPSKNVTINVVSDASNYAAKSGHANGDRTLMSNNADPKIFWTTKALNAGPDTVSGATESINTSWTSL